MYPFVRRREQMIYFFATACDGNSLFTVVRDVRFVSKVSLQAQCNVSAELDNVFYFTARQVLVLLSNFNYSLLFSISFHSVSFVVSCLFSSQTQ